MRRLRSCWGEREGFEEGEAEGHYSDVEVLFEVLEGKVREKNCAEEETRRGAA